MKLLHVSVLLTLLSLTIKAQNYPVIVELFTSQGCSSCPEADKNLTEIIRDAKEAGKDVFGLSFHVDYWNYIGWKDPYSNKEFTERQRMYAHVLNLNSIYTPQMIVNGTYEFIGSDKVTSQVRIEESVKAKPTYQITVSEVKVTEQTISFQCELNKPPSGEQMNIAVVEKSVQNYIPKGENRGKTLDHNNVVRTFKTVKLLQKNYIELSLSSISPSNGSVILYIQNSEMAVLGSASISF